MELIKRDPPATFIPRAEVMPSKRVWGDAEAEQAGLYEDFKPKKPAVQTAQLPPGFVLDTQPAAGLPPGFVLDQQPAPAQEVSNRFAPEQPPQNAEALRAGLQKTAADLTTGEATSPGQKIALDFMNQGSAAAQGTTPNVSAQRGNLVSTDVFQNDAGELQYRDPRTGELVNTDQNKQVVLRDPADNRLKVYQRTDSTNEGRLSSAGRILGTGMATGAPTLRPAVPAMKAPVPTREELLSEAKRGFDAFRNSGVEVPGAAVKSLSQEIGAALNTDGFLDVLAPKTFGVLSKLEAAPDGSTVGAAQLHAIRRTLGRVAASPDPTEKAAAQAAMSRLDEFLGTIPEAQESLAPAIGNYAAAKRSQAVGTAEGRAELNAASAGSGGNIDNTTRQAIKAILKSPKQLRGFSGEEIAQMNQIVRGTFTGNAARLLGKLAPTGVVSGSLSGGAGFLAGGPAGAVIAPLAGYAGKKLADTLTASQMNRLDEMVRANSPLGRSVGASMEAWAQKAEALSNNPTSAKVGAFMLASRNFANNLKDIGITISPREFMRALQAPATGRAEDDQP